MAKTTHKDSPVNPEGAEIARVLARRPEKRFQIRVKNPTFNQERCGIKFIEGRADTDSEQAAKDAARLGYEVADREAGTVVNPLDERAEQGRVG